MRDVGRAHRVGGRPEPYQQPDYRELRLGQSNGIPAEPGVLATGEYSGLPVLPQQPVDNPFLEAAMGPDGIRWVALDATRERDMRYVGAALGVPRRPIDVGYDAATVAEEVSEYNWYNTSKADGGSGICQVSKLTACLRPPEPGNRMGLVPSCPGRSRSSLARC